MIPHLQIIQALSPIAGGTTRPWLVNAVRKGRIDSFVIKFFETKYVDEFDTILMECLCCVLGKEFDLKMPEFVFLEADKMVLSFSPIAFQELYKKDERRPKFGTLIFSPEYKSL